MKLTVFSTDRQALIDNLKALDSQMVRRFPNRPFGFSVTTKEGKVLDAWRIIVHFDTVLLLLSDPWDNEGVSLLVDDVQSIDGFWCDVPEPELATDPPF